MKDTLDSCGQDMLQFFDALKMDMDIFATD